MLICIPYHTDLPVDYKDLAKTIQRFGSNPGHTLAVLSLRSQDEGAFFFQQKLADSFGRLIRASLDDQPEMAVMTSNRFFTAACKVLRKFKPQTGEAEHAPMMYMDPIYRPTATRWADTLQADYFRLGAPKVMGNFRDGEPPSPTGPLVLSREYVETSPLSQFLPHNSHWRNYLAWELLRNSVKATGIGSHATAVLSPPFEP